MCLCCRARCDAGGPLVQSWGFWLMDRFPSGHGILPFCLLTLTCAASEESLGKLNRKGLNTEGNCFDFVVTLVFFISLGFHVAHSDNWRLQQWIKQNKCCISVHVSLSCLVYNYSCTINWNIIKIAIWPRAKCKLQDPVFFFLIGKKCLTKQHYNAALQCHRGALAN